MRGFHRRAASDAPQRHASSSSGRGLEHSARRRVGEETYTIQTKHIFYSDRFFCQNQQVPQNQSASSAEPHHKKSHNNSNSNSNSNSNNNGNSNNNDNSKSTRNNNGNSNNNSKSTRNNNSDSSNNSKSKSSAAEPRPSKQEG